MHTTPGAGYVDGVGRTIRQPIHDNLLKSLVSDNLACVASSTLLDSILFAKNLTAEQNSSPQTAARIRCDVCTAAIRGMGYPRS